MSVNILLIGDPHFKVENIQEINMFLEKIIDIATEKKPDLIIILGDLLHTHERLHTIALNKAHEFVNSMRKIFLTLLILAFYTMNSQDKKSEKVEEKYQILPFGSIKPSGWIKEQMKKDVTGFVGNLDKLVPDLINDPIYSSGRLHKNSEVKDLGNNKEGDTEGSEQYKWWNSETQSNWWDGYIRNVILLNDKAGLKK